MTLQRLLKTIDFFQRNQDERQQEISALWVEFGKTIRSERKIRGIKLADFARDLKLSRTMVVFLESGKRDWNLRMAAKAVKVLEK